MRKYLVIFLLTAIILNNNLSAGYARPIEQPLKKCYFVILSHVSARSKLPLEWCDWITKMIILHSFKYNVDPLLIAAKFSIESKFLPTALSPAGAIGIAQLMPGTASALGFDPYDPAQNIEGGIKYFAQQKETFKHAGAWANTYAVAAYNAGPEAVKDYNGVPPYEETQRHVRLVGEIYKDLLAQFQS